MNKQIKDKEVEVRKLEDRNVALTKRVTKSKSGRLGEPSIAQQLKSFRKETLKL